MPPDLRMTQWHGAKAVGLPPGQDISTRKNFRTKLEMNPRILTDPSSFLEIFMIKTKKPKTTLTENFDFLSYP